LSDSHGIIQLKPASSQIVAVSAMLRCRVNLRHSLPYVSGKRHQPAEQAQLIFTPRPPGKVTMWSALVQSVRYRTYDGKRGIQLLMYAILPHHPFVETAQEEYDQATLNSPASASASKQLSHAGISSTLLSSCTIEFPGQSHPGRDSRTRRILEQT